MSFGLQLPEIHAKIHEELNKLEISNKIKEVMREIQFEKNIDQSSNNDQSEMYVNDISCQKTLEIMKEQGILDQITNNIKENNQAGSLRAQLALAGPSTPDTRAAYLLLEVRRGSAFIEHLLDEDDAAYTLQLHLSFKRQRFRSKIFKCAPDPEINDAFLIRLSEPDAGASVSLPTLLATSERIHLVITKLDTRTGDNFLVASHHLEWRPVLEAPACRLPLNVELRGTGAESQMTVGILQVLLELIPRASAALRTNVVAAQIQLEHSRNAERDKIFLMYTRQWWKEYCEAREDNERRIVKIFAQDECRVNRFVCCYLRPLRAGRLLETPRAAARFVSCLALERPVALGGVSEQWSTGLAFVARNRGSQEDHALLLCCLLLGFGLDAYVCVGRRSSCNTRSTSSSEDTPAVWVLTLGATSTEVVFWEPVTGKRHYHKSYRPERFPEELPGVKLTHSYRSVGCCFNDKAFYANQQVSDLLDTCVFQFDDSARWKAMAPDAVMAVTTPSGLTAGGAGQCVLTMLCSPAMDGAQLSNELETQLRGLVAERRLERGRNSTVWDDQLSYLLGQALASYETERLLGISVGNEEFQHAIRRYVPDNHTFKGYPMQILQVHAKRALSTALRSPVAQEILDCRGDEVRLALRVRVATYAEGATAVWLMLACTYKALL